MNKPKTTDARSYGGCPNLIELLRLTGSRGKVAILLSVGRSSVSRYIKENKAPSVIDKLAKFYVNDFDASIPTPVPVPVMPSPVPAPVMPSPVPAPVMPSPLVNADRDHLIDGAGVLYDPALHADPPTWVQNGSWRKRRSPNHPIQSRILVLSLVPADKHETLARILNGMGFEHFILGER